MNVNGELFVIKQLVETDGMQRKKAHYLIWFVLALLYWDVQQKNASKTSSESIVKRIKYHYIRCKKISDSID